MISLRDNFYKQLDPRREIERVEGSVIGNDKNAMSNCPPMGFQREYPKPGYYPVPEQFEQEVVFNKSKRR